MSESRHDLLQPTLAHDRNPSRAPYSVQAIFLTAFFGGPLAAVGILGANAYFLRRLSRDAPALIAMVLASMAAVWVLYGTDGGAPARAWLEATLGSNGRRLVTRFIALMLVGLGYLLHRAEQRNADFLGLKRPNGWIGGLICTVLGGVLFAVFTAVAITTGAQ